MSQFRNRAKKKHVCRICKRITCINDKRKSKEKITITPSEIQMDVDKAWKLSKAWWRLSNIWRVVENAFAIIAFACSIAVVFIADNNNWYGGADKILDYAMPRFCLYSNGLSPPSVFLIRFSRYQTM